MTDRIAAVFDSKAAAEKAMSDLRRHGIADDQLSTVPWEPDGEIDTKMFAAVADFLDQREARDGEVMVVVDMLDSAVPHEQVRGVLAEHGGHFAADLPDELAA